MTIAEIIEYVDNVKPNAFEEEDKLGWLNELEKTIQTDVWDETSDIVTHESTDEDTLLGAQWDQVYYSYLEARIALACGEFNEYANLMQTYNSFAGEYQRWYCRHYIDTD